MASTTAKPPHRHPVLQPFDALMERALGADMRVIYGMTAPILLVVGLVIVLALHPRHWVVAGIMLVELGSLALVLTGIFGMLADDGSDDEAR